MKTSRSRLETIDRVFAGRVAVIQRRGGFRFALDSLLLARFVEAQARERIVDLGAGNGVIALSLAVLNRGVDLVGVELQAAMVERAERGAALNGVEERVSVIRADVRVVEEHLPPRSFDAAVCNPPYRPPRSGRVNPDHERLLARHEVEGGLADFVRAGAYLLRHRGRMCLVYPSERAVELFAVLRQHRLEPRRVRFVHSFAETPATLVLAEGVKGARTSLTVLPPLVIYRREDEYTDEMAGLLR
ncbi:MAG: tRNA1(Val) (adenine(37)-N6)-methyltransferase [Deltaproteobacteria bacterium]|nr:tRNA1(Val) (adenine(37)-N6)-methyltransferase [Deltaproteobacteria bacterium]